MKFWKLQATGNDFVFINSQPRAGENSTHFVRRTCERHMGVGADGVVFFWKVGDLWKWHYCNSDGSVGEFCGNASLCLAKLLKEEFAESQLRWETLIGEIQAESLPDEEGYTIYFPAERMKLLAVPSELQQELCALNDRGLSDIALVNAGVPHLVLCNHDEWSIEERVPLNMHLRSHPSLGNAGANVSWYSRRNQELVCFERGVDNETLGCGSSALATYMALQTTGEQSFRFLGGILRVEAKDHHYLLKGQPELVFEGIIR